MVGAVVGVLAVVVIGGYLGYRMLFGGGMPTRATSSETTAPTASVLPTPPEPAKSVSPPAMQDSSSTQAMPAAPRAPEAKLLTKEAVANANDAAKAPGAASSKDLSSSAPAKAGAPGAPMAPGATPSAIDPSKPATVAATPGAATAVQPDRWKLMREAMGRCSGESFLKRVTCEQAVGQQYCEGYWGKVPQCPSGPPKERGQ